MHPPSPASLMLILLLLSTAFLLAISQALRASPMHLGWLAVAIYFVSLIVNNLIEGLK
jgi:hypothetical protein